MARTKQTARKAVIPQRNPRISAQVIGGQQRSRSASEEKHDKQINTQQFSVKFDDQIKCQKDSVEGAIVCCSNCAAMLTAQSEILAHDQYQIMGKNAEQTDNQKQKYLQKHENVWICQFCLTHNNVPKDHQVPKIENPCYLIKKHKEEEKKEKPEDGSNRHLIFCVDISGSMDQQIQMKSRLQSVKEALVDQVSRMKFEKEKIKVGLITFGSIVSLIGQPQKLEKIESNLYNNFEGIVQYCDKIKDFCKPIDQCHASIKKEISQLSTYGSTALGPGLVAAISLAMKGAVGSKVILCTDGEANVGLGGNYQGSGNFYNKAADFAKKNRVVVNILSLKGDRCNLKELGKLSLGSGGSMLKIDPKALGTEFSKIAKDQTLGSQSLLTIKVNKIFQIVHHNESQLSKDKTTLTQDYGNFSAETELAFSFKVLTEEDVKEKEGIDVELFKRNRVPMQVQLTYIGRNGSKYLQIITDWRELTHNKQEIYDDMNFGLFAASVLQRSSQSIRSQDYQTAENIIKGYWNLVQSKFSKTQAKRQLDKFNLKIKDIERVLESKRNKTKQRLQPLLNGRISNLRKPKAAKKASKKSSMQNQDDDECQDNDSDSSQSKSKSRSRSPNRGSRGGRGRGGRGGKGVGDKSVGKKASSKASKRQVMSSDSEEEVLIRHMRARSRSHSRENQKN